MTSSYQILGMPMERRAQRRRLVIMVYTVLGLLCAFNIATVTRWAVLTPYIEWAAILAGALIFGGSGRFGNRYGLLKPFSNKPPQPESTQAELLRIRLAPSSVSPDDDRLWRNDERELARRDNAHYRAYGYTAIGPVLILLLMNFSFGIAHRPMFGFLTEQMMRQIVFALTELTVILLLTLPAAIILWNEPDMLTDDADPSDEGLHHLGGAA